MRVERHSVGRILDEPVDAYVLDSGRGMRIVVWTYGATLVEVRVTDRTGRMANVVGRLDDLPAYLANTGYVGATVGRYCRSVRDATFALDGTPHLLDRNAGRHHIHGGGHGFDRRVWRAETEQGKEHAAVHLYLVSPDGDQGYPGTLSVRSSYLIDVRNRLTMEYEATTTASTIVGLTNHAYWNLSGGGVVDRHELALNAGRYLGFDAELLPTAEPPRPVRGTPLDFTRARVLGRQPVDNFFVLDGTDWAADLSDPESGRRMLVRTDAPGLGVYTADSYAAPRSGICLETGAWPDAPNRPDFPSVRLDPGSVHRSSTTHEFRVLAGQR
ncbi:aldose epimerase family protein [Longispora urticae]